MFVVFLVPCPSHFFLIDISLKTKKRQFRYHEEAKRCTLSSTALSHFNSFSQYQSLQCGLEQRILDDFPQPDLNIPPLSLLYNGFGRFNDHITRAASLQTFHPNLKMLVDEFTEKVCETQDEECKQHDLQNILLRILFPLEQISFDYSLNLSNAKSDGHVFGAHGGPISIVEFKCQQVPAEP